MEKSTEIGLLETNVERLLENRFPTFHVTEEDRMQEREENFQTKLRNEAVGLCREDCTVADSSQFGCLVREARAEIHMEQKTENSNRILKERFTGLSRCKIKFKSFSSARAAIVGVKIQ